MNKWYFHAVAYSLVAHAAVATVIDVTASTDTLPAGAPSELRYALNQIIDSQARGLTPSGNTWQVNFSGVDTITLNGILPMINLFNADTITFSSTTPVTIDGNSLYRGFFVAKGNVALENMTFQNCLAKGGNGGGGGFGGGGGMGAGGALFIDQATVSIQNVQLVSNNVTGGNAGAVFTSLGAGGGGGLGGSGGSVPPVGAGTSDGGGGGGGGYAGNGGNGGDDGPSGGGGGGGCGAGGDGGSPAGGGGGGGAILGADGGNAGAPGFPLSPGVFAFGGGGGGTNVVSTGGSGGSGGGTNPGTGGINLGGGGGGLNGSNATNAGGPGGLGGGGGGGAGYDIDFGPGAAGGIGGGGGGGGQNQQGGPGGYGGGAGGGSLGGAQGGFGGGAASVQNTGGQGGFGGGGAASGSGGFGGGGSGNNPGGSGGGNGGGRSGGGAGLGAIAFINNGGTLNILSGCSVGGINTNTGGVGSAGGGTGKGIGGFFSVSGANLIFSPDVNETFTIADTFADDNPYSLDGANNSHVGTGAGATLTMQGYGTLLPTANNTYAGGTIINAGTVSIDGDNNLGKSGTSVSLGGTLQLKNSFTSTRPITLTQPSAKIDTLGNTTTLTGQITGTGGFEKLGGGTLILSNASNNYASPTTVSGGTLQAGASGGFSPNSSIALNSTDLDVNSTTQTILGLTGSGDVSITSGSLTVNNTTPGSLSGNVTIVSGSLTLVDTALHTLSGNVSLGTGSLTVSNSVTETVDAFISGAGQFIKAGNGSLTLTNTSNNYSGGTQLNAGTLVIDTVDTLGAPGASFTANGGTLQFNSSISFNRPITINSGFTINVGSNAVVFPDAITGGQGFNVAGTGSVLLSNASNTYGGSTTIPTGASLLVGGANVLSPNTLLSLGGGVTLNLNNLSQSVGGLTGNGNVSLGSATLTIGVQGGDYSGVISGSGGIIIDGGEFTPRTVQTYTGPTTVLNDGHILVETVDNPFPFTSSINLNGQIILFGKNITLNNFSGDSNSVIIVGNISTPGTTRVTLDGSATTTYQGSILSIAGIDGGLIKQGTGSVTLTNNSSNYLGGTQFNGGTLAITTTDNGSTSGPLGSPTTGGFSFNGGTLEIASNFTTSKVTTLAGPGTIQVDSTFTSTFNTGLQGAGSFTKAGGGTLILPANPYTGDTFITGGVLRPSANQAFIFSPSMNISTGATLDLSSTTTQLLNGLSGGGAVNLGSGELTVQSSGNSTFSGTVTGTGTFIKRGSSSFIASSTSSFNLTGLSSLLSLEEGTFTMDGTATAHTIQVLGGTLKGTGTLSSTLPLAINAGSVAPGNSPGILSVVGDVIFNNFSSLAIEVNPTAASELTATGEINVTDAILLISPNPGIYSGEMTYDIASASTITSPFAGVLVTNPVPSRAFSVSYFPNLIQLTLTSFSLNSLIGNTCSNNFVTAQAYETSNLENADVTFVTIFLNEATIPQLQCDFDHMQPLLFNAIPIIQEETLAALGIVISSRMHERDRQNCACDIFSVKDYSLWLAPLGNFSKQSDSKGSNCDQTKLGFSSSTYGFATGIDSKMIGNLFDQILVGGALSYMHTSINWRHSSGSAHNNDYLATFYTSLVGKGLYFDGMMQVGSGQMEAKRKIVLENTTQTLTRSAKHSNHAFEFDVHAEVGAPFYIQCIQLRPFGSFDYIGIEESDYREHGAKSLDLLVEGRSSKLLREKLGFSCSSFKKREHVSLLGEVILSYVREERFRGKSSTQRFAESSEEFTIEGFAPSRNLFSPQVSLGFCFPKNNFTIKCDYIGEFGKKWKNQTGDIEMRWSF